MQQNKNNKTALIVVGIVIAMIGVSFAAVPLYRIFCQMTGFGGTTMLAEKAPGAVGTRTITISFDARVDHSLPWDFKPEKRKMDVLVGQQGLMNFVASNVSAKTTTGTAVYNVTPEIAGRYFMKTQCFCFAEQALAPGKSGDFPVVFYVDPKILQDPEMDNVTDITLSYTFFATGSKALDKAIETYGQQ